jgi:hypothetical protein
MSEAVSYTVEEAAPPRAEVFLHQGIPAGAAVNARVEEIYQRASGLFFDTADCVGIVSGITKSEFVAVYAGEGGNEPETPVGEIFPRAEHLVLFAVTCGERISGKIEELFRSNDYALACMLDSVASIATDKLAKITAERFREELSTTSGAGSAVLNYSPGYCGWHISGQRKLFEYLGPDRIGITLRESFLMEPLKSVSGVILAGPGEIHNFNPTYAFCSSCTEKGCRERVRMLVGK